MKWVEIAARKPNHTPCYFISSSGVFILENTMNQQVRVIASLFCVFISSEKKTVKSIFVHSVDEVIISKKDDCLLQKNHLKSHLEISILFPLFATFTSLGITCSTSFMQILSVAITLKNSFFCCHLPVYLPAAWVFNVLDCLLPNGSEYIKTRTHTPPANRLGLCLNPNRCIYHSLYSCIIGGRGV